MSQAPLFRPDIRRHVLETLASGEWMKRNAIVRRVHEAVVAQGGDQSLKGITSAVKKCLADMRQSGEVEGGLAGGTFAHYRIFRDDASLRQPASPGDSPAAQSIAPTATILDAQRVIGHGEQSVYCYYYEADRMYAKTQDRSCWACKVRLASRDPAGRLREQGAMTARSAPPVWALEIKTADAPGLERAIHRVLKYIGRKNDAGGGSEWFLTTPQMVESIYLALESLRRWPE